MLANRCHERRRSVPQPLDFRGGRLLALPTTRVERRRPVLTACLALTRPNPESLDLSSSPGDVAARRAVWARSPDLVSARAKIGQAAADVIRSEVFPNPGFDFQWGTLAIGPTNPPGLDKLKPTSPTTPSPSTSRSRSASAAHARLRAAAAPGCGDVDAVEMLRQRWFDLLERISEVATAEIRVGALDGHGRDAQRLADLQLERQKRGDIAGLDVDRAVLEAEKYASNLGQERERLSAALLSAPRPSASPAAPSPAPTQPARSSPAVSRPPRPRPTWTRARTSARSRPRRPRPGPASPSPGTRWIPDPTFRVGLRARPVHRLRQPAPERVRRREHAAALLRSRTGGRPGRLGAGRGRGTGPVPAPGGEPSRPRLAGAAA